MNMKIFAMGMLTTLLATSAFADMSTPTTAQSGTATMSPPASTSGTNSMSPSTMSGTAAPGATSGAMSGTSQTTQ